jgi:hypothetical protein
MADSVGVGRAQGMTIWWFASHYFVSHRVKGCNKGPWILDLDSSTL